MHSKLRVSLFFVAAVLSPNLAFAYVGPGAGLSAIGTVLALVGAILLGIVGFVWYPVKRLLHRKRSQEDEEIGIKPDAKVTAMQDVETERSEQSEQSRHDGENLRQGQG